MSFNDGSIYIGEFAEIDGQKGMMHGKGKKKFP